MIYTSYYANRATAPMTRIRISATTVKGTAAQEYWETVAPDWNTMIGPYKRGEIGEAEYERRYRAMLDSRTDRITAQWRDILRRHGGEDIVLLCWCRKGAFCHRRILAAWLAEHGFEGPREL